MGQLVNGKWTSDQPYAPGPHHNTIGGEAFPFDPSKDAGRYHLYVGHVCPYANRSTIARKLKGLEPYINISVVNPSNTEDGWSFNPKGFEKDVIGDKLLGKRFLHEVYTEADPNYTGRVTIPLLVDTRPGPHSLGGSGKIRIVSNESTEIVEIFDKIGPSGLKLGDKTSGEKSPVLQLVEKYSSGIFKFGSAVNQKQYDEASDEFYEIVDELENSLNTKYLASDQHPTAEDVIAFPFLIRFDSAFSIFFQITRARLIDYPKLGNYLRRMYQYPGVEETIKFDHILHGLYNETSLKKFVKNKEEPIIPNVPRLNLRSDLK